jgi:hypothetical protein
MFKTPSIEFRPPDVPHAVIDEGDQAVREVAVARAGVVDALLGPTVPPEVALTAISLVARRAPAVRCCRAQAPLVGRPSRRMA